MRHLLHSVAQFVHVAQVEHGLSVVLLLWGDPKEKLEKKIWL